MRLPLGLHKSGGGPIPGLVLCQGRPEVPQLLAGLAFRHRSLGGFHSRAGGRVRITPSHGRNPGSVPSRFVRDPAIGRGDAHSLQTPDGIDNEVDAQPLLDWDIGQNRFVMAAILFASFAKTVESASRK
jgi:hypothetical protein